MGFVILQVTNNIGLCLLVIFRKYISENRGIIHILFFAFHTLLDIMGFTGNDVDKIE